MTLPLLASLLLSRPLKTQQHREPIDDLPEWERTPAERTFDREHRDPEGGSIFLPR